MRARALAGIAGAFLVGLVLATGIGAKGPPPPKGDPHGPPVPTTTSTVPTTTTTSTDATTAPTDETATSDSAAATYNSVVLGDGPVAFWNMKTPGSGTETDLTGHGHKGKYHGSPSNTRAMPDSEAAAVFDGSSQYMSVPDAGEFSITHTGRLTVEAWISPGELNQTSGDDYVYWINKGGPTSNEWKGRFYDKAGTDRPNRISGYAYNPGGGLGSGAYWQPVDNLFTAKQWLHVVIEYQTRTTPNECNYKDKDGNHNQPGTIDIWVDGVEWDAAAHRPTGCMSQYFVVPVNGSGALTVASDLSKYFRGAVGKVAIYNKLLTQTQISNHWTAMTGKPVTGSCTPSGCTLS
jgi:hypothetical protein